MPNQEIIDYIKKQLEEGVSETEIRVALRFREFKEEEIEEAFLYVKSEKVLADSAENKNFSEEDFSPLKMLSAAFKNYKDNFGKYFGIIVVPYAGLMLFITLIAFLLVTFGPATEIEVSGALGLSILFFVLMALAVLSFIFVSVWAQVAFWAEVKSAGTLRIKEAFKNSKGKIAPYFWTSILVGVITALGFFLLPGILVSVFPVFSAFMVQMLLLPMSFASVQAIVVSITAVLGLFLLIIPGILFAIWYLFAQMIVVLEDVQGTGALGRSKSYVKGNTRAVFLRLMFALPLFLVVFISLSVLSEDSTAASIIFNLLAIMAVPLFNLYIFEMYKYLKEVKTTGPSAEVPPKPETSDAK